MLEIRAEAQRLRNIGNEPQAEILEGVLPQLQAAGLTTSSRLLEYRNLAAAHMPERSETPLMRRARIGVGAYDIANAGEDLVPVLKAPAELEPGIRFLDHRVEGEAVLTVFRDWQAVGHRVPRENPPNRLNILVQTISSSEELGRAVQRRFLFLRASDIRAVCINIDPLSDEFGHVSRPVTSYDPTGRLIMFGRSPMLRDEDPAKIENLATVMLRLLKDSPDFHAANSGTVDEG